MRGIEARGAPLGARRVERIVQQLAEAAQGEVPGDVRVSREAGAVVLSGRGLRGRALEDVRLRGLGMLAKELR